MVKFVFFLVVGVVLLAVALALLALAIGLAGALLGVILEFLGLLFARLWDCLERLGRFLAQAFARARLRWHAVPPPPLQVSPPPVAPEVVAPEDLPAAQIVQPVVPVSGSPSLVQADDVEPAQPETKVEQGTVEPPIVASPEAALPPEPEPTVEAAAVEPAVPNHPAADLPRPEVDVPAPYTPSPVTESPVVPPMPAPEVVRQNPSQASGPRSPIPAPRSEAVLPPARPMFPQLPDFVGIGRRRFRLLLEKDSSGRPGAVIFCQLLGAFKEGWRGSVRITVTAQEVSDSKHHPLIRLGNPDFDPANSDVVHDFPDGARFGFREWTTVGQINLNDFEGHGSGLARLEVTCRGWELRDKGDLGDLIFEETEALRAVLVTDGYFARKQRRVEQLKAAVVVLRLFVCLDGGERNITNRLNKHFEAVRARFLRRWVGRDVVLRDLINAEFVRRLQGSRLPADIASSSKLSDAPKDLRDWLLQECGEISEEFKPQAPEGEAVRQLAALGKLMGGP